MLPHPHAAEERPGACHSPPCPGRAGAASGLHGEQVPGPFTDPQERQSGCSPGRGPRAILGQTLPLLHRPGPQADRKVGARQPCPHGPHLGLGARPRHLPGHPSPWELQGPGEASCPGGLWAAAALGTLYVQGWGWLLGEDDPLALASQGRDGLGGSHGTALSSPPALCWAAVGPCRHRRSWVKG